MNVRNTYVTAMLAALLAICLCTQSSFAQAGNQQNRGGQGGGRGMMGPAMLDRMHEVVISLNLTDEQKPKIEEIFKKAHEDQQKLMEEVRDMDPQERQQKIRAFSTELQDQVKAVLTDDQKSQFDQKMSEMRPGRGQGQGGAQGGGQGMGGGQIVRRFRDAIQKLDLTEEQKSKAEAIFVDTEKKVREARDESKGDQQAMRDKIRLIAEDTQKQLRDVLTPEQQEKFRQELQQSNNRQGQGRRGGNANPNTPSEPPPGNPPTTQPEKPKGGAMAPPRAAPSDSPDRLAIGEPAPDLSAKKLDGSSVQLSSFRGQLLLICFGSYSSPSFRQRAGGLEAIRRDYSTRLACLVIYTREAHPSGSWDVDRNRDEKIALPEHKDESARKEAARAAQKQLNLRMTVAIDSMDDATAQRYGALPNDAAVLIGKDGTVLAYQKWFEPYAMRDAIVSALGNVAR